MTIGAHQPLPANAIPHVLSPAQLPRTLGAGLDAALVHLPAVLTRAGVELPVVGVSVAAQKRAGAAATRVAGDENAHGHEQDTKGLPQIHFFVIVKSKNRCTKTKSFDSIWIWREGKKIAEFACVSHQMDCWSVTEMWEICFYMGSSRRGNKKEREKHVI